MDRGHGGMTMNKAEKARMAELEAALAGATIKTRAFEEPRPMTRDEIETAKVEVMPRDFARASTASP